MLKRLHRLAASKPNEDLRRTLHSGRSSSSAHVIGAAYSYERILRQKSGRKNTLPA
ncbi:MAG: hypothetical protein V4623_09550 [Pseudomonadota bacterium]